MKDKILTAVALTLTFLLGLLFLLPSWWLPFSLIDDPLFANKAINVASLFSSGNSLGALKAFLVDFPGIDQGRFAFVWMANWVASYLLFGLRPYMHHVYLTLQIGLIAVLLYKTVSKLVGRWAAIISSFIFVISAPGYETWLRLSPQEPVQTISLLLLVYATVFRKKFDKYSLLFLVVFLLAKESSLMIVPGLILGLVLFESKITIRVIKLTGSWFLLAGLLLLLWYFGLRTPDNWSGNAASLGNIVPSLRFYLSSLDRFWFLQLTAIFTGLAYLSVKLGRLTPTRFRPALLFLLIAIFCLLSLLPWKFALDRYLLTTAVFMSAFFGSTLYLVYQSLFHKQTPIWSRGIFILVVVLVLVKFATVNFIEKLNFMNTYIAWEQANREYMDKLISLGSDTIVLVNVLESDQDAREWVERMPKYMEVFYDPAGPVIGFLEPDLSTIDQADYIASWSVYSYQPGSQIPGQLVWEASEIARLPATGLKTAALALLKGEVSQLYVLKEYRWQLYLLER
jgi:hypothetical protein